MSMNSNDPFDNPNAIQGQKQPTYGQDDFAQTPPKKSSRGLWIGCGIAVFLGMLMCCGCIGMLGYFGLDVMTEEIRAEVETSPTIIEHLGEIESMKINITATSEEAQNIQPGQGLPFVFDVQGSKESGQIIVQLSGTGQGIEEAVLVTSSGERIPIELASGPASDFEDIENELNNLEFDQSFETE